MARCPYTAPAHWAVCWALRNAHAPSRTQTPICRMSIAMTGSVMPDYTVLSLWKEREGSRQHTSQLKLWFLEDGIMIVRPHCAPQRSKRKQASEDSSSTSLMCSCTIPSACGGAGFSHFGFCTQTGRSRQVMHIAAHMPMPEPRHVVARSTSQLPLFHSLIAAASPICGSARFTPV